MNADVRQRTAFFEQLNRPSSSPSSLVSSSSSSVYSSKENIAAKMPPAPPKPKRTFEQDIYMAGKAALLQHQSSLPATPIKPEKELKSTLLTRASTTERPSRPLLPPRPHPRNRSKIPHQSTAVRSSSEEVVYAEPYFPTYDMPQSARGCLHYASVDVRDIGKSEDRENKQDSQLLERQAVTRQTTPKKMFSPSHRQLSRQEAFKRPSPHRPLSRSSDSQEEPELEASFSRRVSRAILVRRRTLAAQEKEAAFRSRAAKQLFENVFIVQLEASVSTIQDEITLREREATVYKPITTFCFPEKDKASSSGAPPAELFYPDHKRAPSYKKGDHWPGDECFVIALTDEKGLRTFAYCVKYLPSRDNDACVTPEVLVIVSPLRNSAFYLDLARNAVRHSKRSPDALTGFLNTVFKQEYPAKRGSCLVVSERDDSAAGGRKRVEIRNMGTNIGKPGCSEVIARLSPEVTTCIIAALLADQRVLIAGDKVPLVARTVQAMEALLAPFTWPHTFVPVVPDNLADLCHNPTPYLMGILRHNLSPLRELLVESSDPTQQDFVFIDIDNGLVCPRPVELDCQEEQSHWRHRCAIAFCRSVGMPRRIAHALIKALRQAVSGGTGATADVRVENSMVWWYSMLLGHFQNVPQSGDWKQTKEKFLSMQECQKTRSYLSYLVETVMFEQWVEKRKEVHLPGEILPGSDEDLNRKIDEMGSHPPPEFKSVTKMVSKITAALPFSSKRK